MIFNLEKLNNIDIKKYARRGALVLTLLLASIAKDNSPNSPINDGFCNQNPELVPVETETDTSEAVLVKDSTHKVVGQKMEPKDPELERKDLEINTLIDIALKSAKEKNNGVKVDHFDSLNNFLFTTYGPEKTEFERVHGTTRENLVKKIAEKYFEPNFIKELSLDYQMTEYANTPEVKNQIDSTYKGEVQVFGEDFKDLVVSDSIEKFIVTVNKVNPFEYDFWTTDLEYDFETIKVKIKNEDGTKVILNLKDFMEKYPQIGSIVFKYINDDFEKHKKQYFLDKKLEEQLSGLGSNFENYLVDAKLLEKIKEIVKLKQNGVNMDGYDELEEYLCEKHGLSNPAGNPRFKENIIMFRHEFKVNERELIRYLLEKYAVDEKGHKVFPALSNGI